MDNDGRESYQNFLLQSHVDSLLAEFRQQGMLRMVSVIDLLSDDPFSVYTFYEPDLPRTRFGVYNVLWQIELCHKFGLDFVYLGYWIKHSHKDDLQNRIPARTRPDQRRLAATRQGITNTRKKTNLKTATVHDSVPGRHSAVRIKLVKLRKNTKTLDTLTISCI